MSRVKILTGNQGQLTLCEFINYNSFDYRESDRIQYKNVHIYSGLGTYIEEIFHPDEYIEETESRLILLIPIKKEKPHYSTYYIYLKKYMKNIREAMNNPVMLNINRSLKVNITR